MRAVILIPWRPGTDQRRRQLWDWTRPFLDRIGWPVFEGDVPGEPFSRSAAINAAAADAGDWDVALIGDADTVQDACAAHAAAEQVSGVGLIVPWTHRIKLSAEGTEKLVRHGPSSVTEWDRDKTDPTRPWGGGGTIVVSRAAWEMVGGFDPLFVGYGNEDLAFQAAISALVGPVTRTAGLIWHLWHTPARGVGSKLAATRANQQRWDRYRAARSKPEEMRALVAERREDVNA